MFRRIFSAALFLAIAMAFVIAVPGCGGSKAPSDLGSPTGQKETPNKKKMKEERDEAATAQKPDSGEAGAATK